MYFTRYKSPLARSSCTSCIIYIIQIYPLSHMKLLTWSELLHSLHQRLEVHDLHRKTNHRRGTNLLSSSIPTAFHYMSPLSPTYVFSVALSVERPDPERAARPVSPSADSTGPAGWTGHLHCIDFHSCSCHTSRCIWEGKLSFLPFTCPTFLSKVKYMV